MLVRLRGQVWVSDIDCTVRSEMGWEWTGLWSNLPNLSNICFIYSLTGDSEVFACTITCPIHCFTHSLHLHDGIFHLHLSHFHFHLLISSNTECSREYNSPPCCSVWLSLLSVSETQLKQKEGKIRLTTHTFTHSAHGAQFISRNAELKKKQKTVTDTSNLHWDVIFIFSTQRSN